MLTWTIGDVRITRIVELEVPVAYHPKRPLIAAATPEALREMPWLYPDFVTPEGHLMTSIHALLVEAPALRLVVDTCVGNDKPRRMTGRLPLQRRVGRASPCKRSSARTCTSTTWAGTLGSRTRAGCRLFLVRAISSAVRSTSIGKLRAPTSNSRSWMTRSNRSSMRG